jgi:expansin
MKENHNASVYYHYTMYIEKQRGHTMYKSILFLLFLCGFSVAQLDYNAGAKQGRITYYDQVTVGACDIPVNTRPQYTAALDQPDFQNGLACGATARLINNGKEIQVMIVDLCPTQGNEQWCSGDMPHFDLAGSSTFGLLEPVSAGVKVLQFQWIPTPVGTSPIKLRYKDGTNAWWVAIEVLNHRYPILKVEVKNPQTGAWMTSNRTQAGWNYWVFQFTGSGLQTPYQIRITDQYGHAIEETATTIQASYMWTGANQFPLRPEDAAVEYKILPKNSAAAGVSIVKNRLFTAAAINAPIIISDLHGRAVAVAHGDGSSSVILPRLPQGVYSVSIPMEHSLQRVRWTCLNINN